MLPSVRIMSVQCYVRCLKSTLADGVSAMQNDVRCGVPQRTQKCHQHGASHPSSTINPPSLLVGKVAIMSQTLRWCPNCGQTEVNDEGVQRQSNKTAPLCSE